MAIKICDGKKKNSKTKNDTNNKKINIYQNVWEIRNKLGIQQLYGSQVQNLGKVTITINALTVLANFIILLHNFLFTFLLLQ